MKCCNTGQLAWFRFSSAHSDAQPSSHTHRQSKPVSVAATKCDGHAAAPTAYTSQNRNTSSSGLCVGDVALVTNLKPSWSMCKIPHFSAGPNSTIRKLAQPRSSNGSDTSTSTEFTASAAATTFNSTSTFSPAHFAPPSSAALPDSVTSSSPSTTVSAVVNLADALVSTQSSLRAYMNAPHSQESKLTEASFQCTIINWFENFEDDRTADSSSGNGVVFRVGYLEIQAVDESRVTLLLRYPTVYQLLPGYKKTWLRCGMSIRVTMVQVQSVDTMNDVIAASRGEHTLIEPVQLWIEHNLSDSSPGHPVKRSVAVDVATAVVGVGDSPKRIDEADGSASPPPSKRKAHRYKFQKQQQASVGAPSTHGPAGAADSVPCANLDAYHSSIYREERCRLMALRNNAVSYTEAECPTGLGSPVQYQQAPVHGTSMFAEASPGRRKSSHTPAPVACARTLARNVIVRFSSSLSDRWSPGARDCVTDGVSTELGKWERGGVGPAGAPILRVPPLPCIRTLSHLLDSGVRMVCVGISREGKEFSWMTVDDHWWHWLYATAPSTIYRDVTEGAAVGTNMSESGITPSTAAGDSGEMDCDGGLKDDSEVREQRKAATMVSGVEAAKVSEGWVANDYVCSTAVSIDNTVRAVRGPEDILTVKSPLIQQHPGPNDPATGSTIESEGFWAPGTVRLLRADIVYSDLTEQYLLDFNGGAALSHVSKVVWMQLAESHECIEDGTLTGSADRA